MTLRTRFQRHALLAASAAVVTGGVLLPGSAFAATQAPPPPSPIAAAHWVEITDAPSGIKAELPAKPEVQKFTKAKDGIDGRVYMAGNDDRVTGFGVFDVHGAKDLKDNLRAFLAGFNEDSRSRRDVLSSTSTKATEVDGRRALDAQLSAEDGTVGSTRIIDEGSHYVQLVSISSKKEAASMAGTHQRLLDSLRMPARGDTGAA
ncbi:hypothetical protein [Streptomyces sp. NPDC058964]|uniref:hypothetical protein n=1 Tax=Streptomyces sp. NPDC058964 TaxID=3346681 RepID=UPI0036C639C2